MLKLIDFEDKCLFCDPKAYNQENQILLKSNNFYLFAGIGPIIEGYIILAPYRCDNIINPYQTFADVPSDLLDEAIFLRGLISEFYRDVYNQESSMHFEHGRAGACFPGVNISRHCNHAHLCCYPFSSPLWEDIKDLNILEILEIKDINDLSFVVNGKSYLLIQCSFINNTKKEDSSEREYWQSKVVLINKDLIIETQYLRKLLARKVNKEDEWDWALFPKMDLVKNIINKFNFWIKDSKKYYIDEDTDGFNRIDFLKSVEKSNLAGNNNVAEDFHRVWAGKEQYEAIGKFVSYLPKFNNEKQQRRPKILDVGCGPGHYLKSFTSMGLECTGIDISDEMIKIARQFIENKVEENQNVFGELKISQLRQMSLFNLSFDESYFDGIWYSAVIVHIPRAFLLNILATLNKILQNNGILYISALLGKGCLVRREGRVFFYYQEHELKNYFDKAGFYVFEQWYDATNIGSKGDTRVKKWIHFILKKKPLNEKILYDYGERNLLKKIQTLIPLSSSPEVIIGIGDDCAVIKPSSNNDVLVTTTDPCPKPVINLIEEEDYWYDGWYSVIINLSDLGAMGAKPIGIVLAIEARNDMKFVDFERFYQGALEASKRFNCPIIGGNLKDANRFNCVGTALGSINPQKILKRNAAKPDEMVIVVGEMGKFWAGVIANLESLDLTKYERQILLENLKYPIPKIKEGIKISENGIARCAIDSSDGIIACLYEIAQQSNVNIHLDFSNINPHPLVEKVAKLSNIDLRKIMLSWGNWELVVTVEKSNLEKFKNIIQSKNCPVNVIGTVKPGDGKVMINNNNKLSQINYVASERFSINSYFLSSINNFLNFMREEPLTI